jgi:MFS family permease
MFAPGIPLVMAEFKSTNETLGSFAVSVYLLGYTFGPLSIASLSELYGRRTVYQVNTALVLVFTAPWARSTTLGMLIGFRFLSGRVGSSRPTMGPGGVAASDKRLVEGQ